MSQPRWLTCIAILVSFLSQATANESIVRDILSERPSGVRVLYLGAAYSDFERPRPAVVEGNILERFTHYYNRIQAFNAAGPNTYKAEGRQLVASIADGRITGVIGSVYDSNGRVFTEFSASRPELGVAQEKISTLPCKRFKRLATAVQKYGHMYYHFVQEVLPRIILLRPFLDADTKLLLFGSSYELKWLAELGIPEEQVEIYDPSQQYCAEELIVPTLSPIVTPPKENYDLIRSAFKADITLPEEQRDLIIYCSRAAAEDRHVANEAQLLQAVSGRFPSAKLRVYTGQETAAETIALFQRARVVVGMHGAGLSHIVFAAPGTAVVEFLFMKDPPMMFWHVSGALSLRYVMVPLSQSWWLDPDVEVPQQDVLDALALALNEPTGPCALGHAISASTGKCAACPSGTYRPAGSSSCLACAAGRVSPADGAAFCSTCPTGSFSSSSFVCERCPADAESTMFPGSSSADMCRPEAEIEVDLDVMFDQGVLSKKLVSLPAFQKQLPKSALGWLSLAPAKLLSVLSQRQLKFKYLGELFLEDRKQHPTPEVGSKGDLDDDVVEENRRSRTLIGGSYGRRGVLNRRSLHQMSQSEDEEENTDDTEIMTTSSNPYRRRLHDRSLHQSEEQEENTGDIMESMLRSFNPYRRRLQQNEENENAGDNQIMTTSFNPYRRRLQQQYGRRLHKSMRRSLSQYGWSLMQSYGRRLRTMGSWGRRLKVRSGPA